MSTKTETIEISGDEVRLMAGDEVRLIVPGVPEWKIPATERAAILTAENIQPIAADISETMAGVSDARLFVNGSEIPRPRGDHPEPMPCGGVGHDGPETCDECDPNHEENQNR